MAIERPTVGEIRTAKRQAVGGGRKRCRKGKNCSAACIQAGMECLVEMPESAGVATSKVRDMLQSRLQGVSKKMPAPPRMQPERMYPSPEDRALKQQGKGILREMRVASAPPAATSAPADYSKWKPVAEGNYGKVSVSPDGTRAVKELLVGKDGKKGEFGEFEVELAKKMGDLGHSPRIYKATDKALEMDVAPGKPLWKSYQRGEDEPVMNAAQATKAAAAIRDLHKLGYAHGDLHSQQFLVDGNNVKLVDYGLSVPTERQPVRVLQDLSKINSLVRWNNPEIANDPYVKVVNKHLDAYRAVKGESKAAKAEKERIAQEYLRDVKALSASPPASPKAAMTTKVSQAGGNWESKYRGRTPALDEQLDALSAKISKLSPEQQTYWNEQVNKQMNPKLVSRNGTPYSPEKTNRSLTSQARAWNYLVENGQPAELMNRIGEKRPAPKGMIPDVTSSGQRKWISPDDGLKYSLRQGSWRQNRVSKADTDRRLPDITNFRKEQQSKGEAWPTQKMSPREGLPKTVDAVIKGLSPAEKNSIVFNGLDATGNEGIKLRQYYNDNPKEKDARLREIVQRWHDQGGRSGVSGKPVALPGLDAKPGEERSSVDHFQPISTNRAAALPGSEMRKIADNYKNFLIAEEGPNSQRGARTWDSWLDRREGQGKAPSRIKIPRAPAVKSLTEDQQERVSTAARMTNYRLDKRIREGIYDDDERSKGIIAARKEQLGPLMKMSSNEKAALSLYGQDGVKFYQQVNQMLRGGDFEGSTPEKKQLAEFIAGNLNKGLSKLPPAKVERLERAVSGDFASGMAKLKVGDVIQDNGFGSYTDKGTPTLNQFIKKDQPNAVIRVISPKTAREVAPAMEYSSEGEHISMPGTRYKMVEIQEKGTWSRKLNDYVPTYVFEEVEG